MRRGSTATMAFIEALDRLLRHPHQRASNPPTASTRQFCRLEEARYGPNWRTTGLGERRARPYAPAQLRRIAEVVPPHRSSTSPLPPSPSSLWPAGSLSCSTASRSGGSPRYSTMRRYVASRKSGLVFSRPVSAPITVRATSSRGRSAFRRSAVDADLGPRFRASVQEWLCGSQRAAPGFACSISRIASASKRPGHRPGIEEKLPTATRSGMPDDPAEIQPGADGSGLPETRSITMSSDVRSRLWPCSPFAAGAGFGATTATCTIGLRSSCLGSGTPTGERRSAG